jgi:DNA polymerase-3 subunit alpha
MLGLASRAGDERRDGQSALFGAADVQSAFKLPAANPWPAAERLRREFDAVGFFLSGHPLDDYETILKRLRIQRWSEFSRAVKDGATSARLAATVLDRMERRTKSGNKIGIVNLSDPTGQFEAIMFQETLNEHRDLFEKGSVVLMTVQASLEGDEVRVRILTAEALDAAAHRMQKGLRIHLRDAAPLAAIASRLDRKGDGEVSIVVMLEGKREVEVKLPGRFGLSPLIAGALKAVPGVLAVENI